MVMAFGARYKAVFLKERPRAQCCRSLRAVSQPPAPARIGVLAQMLFFGGLIDERGTCCFFQLELIIDSETGFASSTNILNLVDQLKGKKMRKKEAEQVLQKFVQNKWLIEVVWFPQPGTFRTENSFSLKPYCIQLLSVELGPIRPLVCFNAHWDPMRRTWSLPLARVMWPGHPGQKCRAGTAPGLALWSTDVGRCG